MKVRMPEWLDTLLLPATLANLYSLYGVLALNWSVADLFFWFWLEFVLCGVAVFVLTQLWLRGHPETPPHLRRLATFSFLFAGSLLFFYASLFAGMAYHLEWQTWSRFPEFLAGRVGAIIILMVTYGTGLAANIFRRDYLRQSTDDLMWPFTRKCIPILGIYVITMFQYHWTGARHDFMDDKIKELGVLLISLKLLLDLGAFRPFYRWLRKPARLRA